MSLKGLAPSVPRSPPHCGELMELLGGGGMLRNLYVTVCVLEMTVGPKSLFCVLTCSVRGCQLTPPRDTLEQSFPVITNGSL